MCQMHFTTPYDIHTKDYIGYGCLATYESGNRKAGVGRRSQIKIHKENAKTVGTVGRLSQHCRDGLQAQPVYYRL